MKKKPEAGTQNPERILPGWSHSGFWLLAFGFLVFTTPAAYSEILDRIAVTVGKHAIKSSDIERDLRVTEFLNREPLNLSSNARRAAAERLIDQALISDEIADGGYTRPADSDAGALLNRIRRERFGGSDGRLREGLSAYALTEDQLRQQLLWQLEVLRFIDERFRSGVVVTNDEVRSYYEQHRTELTRQNPKSATLEALEPGIRQALEGERINRNFTQWLEQSRRSKQIQYHQEAFG